jgi:hypothetical protein
MQSFYATGAKSSRQLGEARFSPSRSGEAARGAGLYDIEMLERVGAQHRGALFLCPACSAGPSPLGSISAIVSGESY